MVIYPFEPRGTLLLTATILFAVLATAVLMVFAQMDRHPMLSVLSGTKPGKLSRNFVFSLLSYGLIPGLTLLVSHFPSLGRYVFLLADPALRALH